MILFTIFSCHSPSNVLVSTEKWVKQEKGRYKCELTNQYSTEQRRNMYPFNKAETVLFIAYENYLNLSKVVTKTVADTIFSPDGRQLISDKEIKGYISPCDAPNVIKQWQQIKGSLLRDMDKYCAIESIKLNQAQIDTLSNILFNYKLTIKGFVQSEIKGCYTPRNTIIFLDKAENPIGYIEICFECSHIGGSDMALSEIASSGLCYQKFSNIHQLFKNVGIHFGIDKR